MYFSLLVFGTDVIHWHFFSINLKSFCLSASLFIYRFLMDSLSFFLSVFIFSTKGKIISVIGRKKWTRRMTWSGHFLGAKLYYERVCPSVTHLLTTVFLFVLFHPNCPPSVCLFVSYCFYMNFECIFVYFFCLFPYLSITSLLGTVCPCFP